MSYFSKFKLPFRQDSLVGLIFLTLFLVPLAFISYLADPFETVKLPLLIIAVAVAFLIVVWRGVIELKYHKWVLGLSLAFVVWSIISTIFSLDPVISIVGLYGRYTSSVLFYGAWVGLIVLFWSAGSEEKFHFWAKTLIAVSAIIAVFGLIQDTGFAFYAGSDPNALQRVPSFLGNPNFSSMFIVSLLPFAIIYLWQSSRWARIYYGLVSVAIIWAATVFGSRGSLLALAAELGLMIGLLVVLKFSKKTLLLTGAALLASVAFFLLFYNFYRPSPQTPTQTVEQIAVENRFVVWDTVTGLIAQSPWLGTGPGNLFQAIRQEGNILFAATERFDDAHNLFLNIAAMGGLPFLGLFLAILATAGWAGWQRLRQTKDPLILAGLTGLVGLVISASFNPVVIACWLLLAFLIALLTAHRLKTFRLPEPARLPAALITTVVVAVLIVYSIGLLAGHAYFTMGQRNYRAQDYASAEKNMRLASRFNPLNDQALVFLAGSLIQQNKSLDEAEKYINRSIALHPTSAAGYQITQKLFYMLYHQTNNPNYLKRMDEAIAQGLAYEPSYTSEYNQIAFLYFTAGQIDKARHYAQRSLVLDSKQFYVWLLLSKIYQVQGQPQQALFALEQAHLIQPDILFVRKIYEHAKTLPPGTSWEVPLALPEPNI